MIKGSGARAKSQPGALCHRNVPRQTQRDPKRDEFVLLPFLSNGKPPQVQGDSDGQPAAAGEAKSALLLPARSALDVPPREAMFCAVRLKKPPFHPALVGGQLITIPPHATCLQHGEAGGRAGLWWTFPS